MSHAVIQLNLSEDKQGFFCRIPLRIGAKGQYFSPSMRALAGKVYGTTKTKKNTECWTSYDQLREELGVCRETVANAIKSLKENDIIKENGRDRQGTAYTYVGDAGKRYDVVPMPLFTMHIAIAGKYRKLRKSEVLVLGHIMTECNRLKNLGKYETSNAIMARRLNLSEVTVRRAVNSLICANLLHRPERGVNASKLAAYTIDRELRALEREWERKRRVRKLKEKVQNNEMVAEALEAERRKFYEERRKEAQRRAEKYIESIENIPEYKAVDTKIRKIKAKWVRAELDKAPEFAALDAEMQKLKAMKADIMKRFNINPQRKDPHYYARCKQCMDTGVLLDGTRCTCFDG